MGHYVFSGLTKGNVSHRQESFLLQTVMRKQCIIDQDDLNMFLTVACIYSLLMQYKAQLYIFIHPLSETPRLI